MKYGTIVSWAHKLKLNSYTPPKWACMKYIGYRDGRFLYRFGGLGYEQTVGYKESPKQMVEKWGYKLISHEDFLAASSANRN